MPKANRRDFLIQAGAGIGASVASATQAATAQAANERIVVGVIGCGGRGVGLGRTFNGQSDATVAYVCDPDRARAERAKEATGADRAVADMRVILDDKAVDAVVIATCDHWHAPAAILACKAGKHVYVEKPCSHNVREGRLMVEAARKHNVVMQHGTQSRSNPGRQKAVQILRDGTIGEVLIAKHVNSQKRANIGHVSPSEPPQHLDYDLWVGPAEWRPNADIEIGHLSSSLCHLGNIVARVGRSIRFDPEKEQVVGEDQANALLRRKYREDHWAVPEGI